MDSRVVKTSSNTTAIHICRLPGSTHPADTAEAAHKAAPPA